MKTKKHLFHTTNIFKYNFLHTLNGLNLVVNITHRLNIIQWKLKNQNSA